MGSEDHPLMSSPVFFSQSQSNFELTPLHFFVSLCEIKIPPVNLRVIGFSPKELCVQEKDESSTFRSHAVRALGRIGPEARDAVKTLEMIHRDMHGGRGLEAAWALKIITTREKKDPVVPKK
jgi:hypothetical protein